MGEIKKHIKEQLNTLPSRPGIYQFLDAKNKIIYIGKAKNLKKRVSSYFNKHAEGKTYMMLKNLDRIEHIVTDNETEAFLLENVLIKQYKPKYNVLLKDDKTYPWIVIRNEAFPRVEMTRNYIKDGSEYFGPYTSVKTVRVLLDLIHDIYPIRTCKLDLQPSKIQKKNYKVCLEYHLGRCKAPCIGEETEEDYKQYIEKIRQILKGNFKPALQFFENEMKNAAANLEFEKAQEFKEKIEALQNYQSRSTVVNPKIGNVEVYSILSDTERAYVNFMEVSNGSIIRARNLEYKKKINEADQEILSMAVTEIHRELNLHAKEIILPMKIEIPFPIKQTVPHRGDKKKLLEMSLKNARYFKLEKLKQLQQTRPDLHLERMLRQMQHDLHLSNPPRHMECFDISHTQGFEKTASCVVFKDLKPSKKDYRHYTVKTVEGIDDFASMKEVVYRRYKRLKEENIPLPGLVVIDGGKGQLNAALDALKELKLDDQITLIGIAKRLEEIYKPGDPVPLYLDKRSETLKIIQQIRNEAHRFGLRLHRKRRTKRLIPSTLTSIPGIGEKTALKLLKHFKSIKQLQEASQEEIAQIVGHKTAEKIKKYL